MKTFKKHFFSKKTLVISLFSFIAFKGYLSKKKSDFYINTVFKNSSVKEQREHLLSRHEFLAFNLEKNLDQYERDQGIDFLRLELLSHLVPGPILETAIGTNRNLPYYPEGSKILGVDWAENMIEASLKKFSREGVQLELQRNDSEKLSLADDLFDNVVDTFGMEYYLRPEKALKEMSRVCKKGSRILLLTIGASSNTNYLKWFQKDKEEPYLREFGCFAVRDWDEIIKNSGLKILKEKREMDGTLYFYVLENNK